MITISICRVVYAKQPNANILWFTSIYTLALSKTTKAKVKQKSSFSTLTLSLQQLPYRYRVPSSLMPDTS